MNYKEIGKPTKEIRVNLSLFNDKPLGVCIKELERQDSIHNTTKSYGLELK